MAEKLTLTATGGRTYWDVIKSKIGFNPAVAWQNLTLQNGVQPSNPAVSYTPSFHKDSLGFVRLRGGVSFDMLLTNNQNLVIAVLPVGYRPTKQLSWKYEDYYVSITPAGEIIFYKYGAVAGNWVIPLESFGAFLAEQ